MRIQWVLVQSRGSGVEKRRKTYCRWFRHLTCYDTVCYILRQNFIFYTPLSKNGSTMVEEVVNPTVRTKVKTLMLRIDLVFLDMYIKLSLFFPEQDNSAPSSIHVECTRCAEVAETTLQRLLSIVLREVSVGKWISYLCRAFLSKFCF